jgi:hypothetical protein
MMQFFPKAFLQRVRGLFTAYGAIAAALLFGTALVGCQTNLPYDYKAGYDKRLTAESWATRAPDETLVIIGGHPSVWQKSDEEAYAFETRPRYQMGLFGGYDAVLLRAGTYHLQTLVGAGGNFADFSAYKWSTEDASSRSRIASFEVGPGQVVYVGNLDAQVTVEDVGTCWAAFSVSDASPRVIESFAKEGSYVKTVPATALLTVSQNSIRFRCDR